MANKGPWRRDSKGRFSRTGTLTHSRRTAGLNKAVRSHRARVNKSIGSPRLLRKNGVISITEITQSSPWRPKRRR